MHMTTLALAYLLEILDKQGKSSITFLDTLKPMLFSSIGIIIGWPLVGFIHVVLFAVLFIRIVFFMNSKGVLYFMNSGVICLGACIYVSAYFDFKFYGAK